MFELMRKSVNRTREDKANATLLRMVVAFTAGMVITAFLAYVPAITDILAHNFSQESAVPAPSNGPDFHKPGSGPEGSGPAEQKMSALVYTPCKEGAFSV
jgi:hypothetical protein